MHELSITNTIVKMIEEECLQNKVKNPKRIIIELGRFTTYSGDSIKMFYEMLKRESEMLKGSELIIKEIHGMVECRNCKKTSRIDDPIMIFCMHCNSNDVKIISGKELNIKSITE